MPMRARRTLFAVAAACALAARGLSRRGRARGRCGRDQGARVEAGVGSPPRPRATPISASDPARPEGSGRRGPLALLPLPPRRAYSSVGRGRLATGPRRPERDPSYLIHGLLAFLLTIPVRSSA